MGQGADHHNGGRAHDPLRCHCLAGGIWLRERLVGPIDDVGTEPNQHDQSDEGRAHGGGTAETSERSRLASTVLFDEPHDRRPHS
jgi:hypothetical protein